MCAWDTAPSNVCHADAPEPAIEKCRLKENSHGKKLDVGKDPLKQDKPDEESSHRIGVSADPVEIPLGAILRHQQHNPRAAIEWRNRQKIKSSQEQIQREDHAQDNGNEIRTVGNRIAMEHMVVARKPDSEGGQKHESEISSRTGHRHPGGTVRMTPLPQRIVGGASPTNHAPGEEETQDGNDHHAKKRTANVGNRIQGNLASESRRRITA